MASRLRLEPICYGSLLVLLFSSLTTNAARLCYNIDGSVATGDVECNTTASVSTCCGSSYACLSNNLCIATTLTDTNSTHGYQYARGTCTDQEFKNNSCPLFCDNATNGDLTYSGEFMLPCGVSGVQSYVCLNGNEYNCETGENVVTFSGPAPTYVYNPADTNSRETPTATPTPTASATAVSGVATTTGASPSATTSAAASSGGSSNAVSIGVGVGVGVPLGLAALFLAFYFYRRNVKSKARHQAIPSSDPSEGPERKEPPVYGGRAEGMTSPAPRYSDYVGNEHGSYEMHKTQPQQQPVQLGELPAEEHRLAPMELDARREAQELP